ncbi:uncharacterized protein LOC126733749 [Anthonomus grandis grandis]|uniref:uncharacterized protein LOC126733749 n=1 Tax=Anthonomus grandis grandis TaxID=2921223 RepID=UPI0021656AE0|nr:uncharacterized protein LOC126733749 [Anthonomus grandis grandis]
MSLVVFVKMKLLIVCILLVALQASGTPILHIKRAKKEIFAESDPSSNALDVNKSKATENNTSVENEPVKNEALKNNTQPSKDNLKTNGPEARTIEANFTFGLTDKPKIEKLAENLNLSKSGSVETPLFHGNEFKVRVLDLPRNTEDYHPFQNSIGSKHHPGIFIPASAPKVESLEIPEGSFASDHHFYSYPVLSAPFKPIYDFPSLPVSYPTGSFSEALNTYPSIYPVDIPQHAEYPVFGEEHHFVPVISDISQLPSATPILPLDGNFGIAEEHIDDQSDSVSVEAVEPLSKINKSKVAVKKDDLKSNAGSNKTEKV